MKDENEKILVLSPFRNEAHSIDFYVCSMFRLRWPLEPQIYWLENDSTDDTHAMLLRAREFFEGRGFPVKLESANIVGPQLKKPPGEYFKDIPYGKELRKKGWLGIWREYFLPEIRESDAEYVLVWMADAVPPSDALTSYFKVFEEYPDAGWVGGAYHRRYPRHGELLGPMFEEPVAKLPTSPTPCLLTTHFWVMRTDPLRDAEFTGKGEGLDMHVCLVRQLESKGLRCYYDPDVYIKHLSTDRRIYRHGLDGDEKPKCKPH